MTSYITDDTFSCLWYLIPFIHLICAERNTSYKVSGNAVRLPIWPETKTNFSLFATLYGSSLSRSYDTPVRLRALYTRTRESIDTAISHNFGIRTTQF